MCKHKIQINQYPENQFKTIAIGDSQNDIAMLDVADIALLIRSPTHGLPVLESNNKVYESKKFSTQAWVEGVEQILTDLNVQL